MLCLSLTGMCDFCRVGCAHHGMLRSFSSGTSILWLTVVRTEKSQPLKVGRCRPRRSSGEIAGRGFTTNHKSDESAEKNLFRRLHRRSRNCARPRGCRPERQLWKRSGTSALPLQSTENLFFCLQIRKNQPRKNTDETRNRWIRGYAARRTHKGMVCLSRLQQNQPMHGMFKTSHQ